MFKATSLISMLFVLTAVLFNYASSHIAVSCASTAFPLPGSDVLWARQFGTSTPDWAISVSADRLGNVYTAGRTAGDLSGSGPVEGLFDIFVNKFNRHGDLLWTRQVGSSRHDRGQSVSADGAGNVFVAGYTEGGNVAGDNAGGWDALLFKYGVNGDLLWSRQLGTSGHDAAQAVAADGLGNVYIAGRTTGSLDGSPNRRLDAFLTKYDGSGDMLWTHQLRSTDDDYGYGVAPDGQGNIYISGTTEGNLADPNFHSRDAFVAKFDVAGNHIWTRQIGAPNGMERSDGVSVDAVGNVYVIGSTNGDLAEPNLGGFDVFLRKYDPLGNPIWTRQLGTETSDYGFSVSADGIGNVYISGETRGSLAATNPTTEYDAFISTYTEDGALIWTQQFGTRFQDQGFGVSADGQGNVFLGGVTGGDLFGVQAGDLDSFIMKIGTIPEPASFGIAIVLLPLCVCRRQVLRKAERRRKFNPPSSC